MYSISSTTRTFVRLCSDERCTAWIMERPAGSLASCLKHAHTHTHSAPQCTSTTRQPLWVPADASKGDDIEALPPPPLHVLYELCISCISLKSLSFSITTNSHYHETPFFFNPTTVLSVSRCPGTTQLYFGIIFKINYLETSNAFPVMVPPPQFSCFCLCLSLFLSPSLFFCVFCRPEIEGEVHDPTCESRGYLWLLLTGSNILGNQKIARTWASLNKSTGHNCHHCKHGTSDSVA